MTSTSNLESRITDQFDRTVDAVDRRTVRRLGLADTNNSLRAELDLSDRFRIFQFESGNVSVFASAGGFSGATNTWYKLTIAKGETRVKSSQATNE